MLCLISETMWDSSGDRFAIMYQIPAVTANKTTIAPTIQRFFNDARIPEPMEERSSVSRYVSGSNSAALLSCPCLTSTFEDFLRSDLGWPLDASQTPAS